MPPAPGLSQCSLLAPGRLVLGVGYFSIQSSLSHLLSQSRILGELPSRVLLLGDGRIEFSSYYL